jgi:hypothetical protein
MKIVDVHLPYDFKARDYQEPQTWARTDGIDRFCKVWHRRAGKDLSDIHFTVQEALLRRGTYWHIYPQFNQAKRALWNNMTSDGKKFIDAFPPCSIKKINNVEMRIELVNGSIWQVVGSDNVDALVGANPVGVVFSEYSLTDPKAWPLIEPILLENGGWAIFNGTPRGENHFFDM